MDIKGEIKRVLQIEADAIAAAILKINADYEKALNFIMTSKGKVVVSGVGKSGLIGQKIASTMASTGTPAIFVHPTEAAHGDLGMIMKNDVVILLSQSGETEETIDLIPSLKRKLIPIIAITGKADSSLAKESDAVLNSHIAEEACPHGLAPTASTSVQLAIGDAIAVALLKLRGFQKEDFAMLHPGGSLGKKLLLKVKDVMHEGEAVPMIGENETLKKALLEMTKKRFGCVAVTGPDGKMIGIFTDGDLRRLLEKTANPFDMKMKDIMIVNPKTIGAEALVVKALAIMEEKTITVLMVPDAQGKPSGVIHLHDILKAGVV
ncbi:MAG: KpsF/GutQ family sugar-phosphate isomerase [bacterium]